MTNDLFSNKKEPLSILEIRALKPGKAKDEYVLVLAKEAETFLNENKHLGIYISTNVASSKNSKEIGTYKKYDENHVLQTHHILRNSAVTERYKLTSRPQWVNYRKGFLELTEGLKLPLMVEMTFIRDSLRRFDFINASQVIFDTMVECGYIPDDETCYICPSFNPTVFYSKVNAGVFLKVMGGNDLKLAF